MTKQPKPEFVEIKDVQVQFKCPGPMRDQMKAIAREQDRTLAKQILRVLREWLRDRKDQVK